MPLAWSVAALALAACGGGGDGGSSLALGEQAVVEHTEFEADGSPGARTTLGVTVLAVRQGTQEQLEEGGFSLDPEERSTTPYYVDARFENRGEEPIDRRLYVSLEDEDGNLVSSTTVIDLGGSPFELCPQTTEGDLGPGESFETCSLFLVPEGREPERASFLPYDPEAETEFVYWEVG